MNIVNHSTSSRMRFTTWECRLLGGGIVALLLLLTACEEFSGLFYPSLREHDPPPWHGASVTVDLTSVLHPLVYEMEFAARNAPYIGFWTLPPTESELACEFAKSGRTRPCAFGQYVVINFQGDVVMDAVTASGALSERYVELFPTIAAKQQYAEFLQKAEFWAFSPDGTYGMKADTCYTLNDRLNEQKGMYARTCQGAEIDFVNFELWDMSRDKLLWENIVRAHAIRFAQLLTWQGQPAVLIALPFRADIVSRTTGEPLGSFEYARSEKDKVGNAQGYGIFMARHIAYHADARWLACGDFDTRRIRIYGIDSPYPLLRELNQPPRSGAWSVDRVTLDGNRRYLTVATSFSTMGMRNPRFPTEVYEVTTWKRVWYENRHDIWDVTVSPDGQKIAFLRMKPPDYEDGIWLEMGDFSPEETP